MAPKKNVHSSPSPAASPASANKAPQATTSATQPLKPATKPASSTTSSSGVSFSSTSTSIPQAIRNPQDAQQIVMGVWNKYVAQTPGRVKLVDAFMGFLVVVGVLQFVYCVIGGNYPFNAFLAGFSATVGQFVLTASLRMQTNTANQAEFAKISHERAFADFVFGSMILHFFCVNFIN